MAEMLAPCAGVFQAGAGVFQAGAGVFQAGAGIFQAGVELSMMMLSSVNSANAVFFF